MTSSPDRHALTHLTIDRRVADRLAAAKLWLIATSSPTSCGDLPYLATALYALIPVASPAVHAMTVDRNWRIYVNPTWVLTNDVPAVAGRMAHLVWHLLAEHADRADDLDVRAATASQWEKAADATIAELLPGLDALLKTPRELGLPEGRSTEEYYALLSLLPVPPPPDSGLTAPPDQQPAGSASDGTCGSGCDGQHRDYELPIADNAGLWHLGRADADEIRRRVAIAFRQHQASSGAAPGQWARWVEQILDPIVPWPQVLAAAVRRGIGWAHGHADYTYTRISRRQAAAGPIILPATRRPIPEVAIVIDTSGSIDDGLLAQALGEIDGILVGLGVSGRSVTVLATDAEVHSITRVTCARQARIHGGGGTDMGKGMRAALELRPRPTLVVVLTDGYTPWPDHAAPLPVLAVVIGRARHELPATPPWIQRVECCP